MAGTKNYLVFLHESYPYTSLFPFPYHEHHFALANQMLGPGRVTSSWPINCTRLNMPTLARRCPESWKTNASTGTQIFISPPLLTFILIFRVKYIFPFIQLSRRGHQMTTKDIKRYCIHYNHCCLPMMLCAETGITHKINRTQAVRLRSACCRKPHPTLNSRDKTKP